MARSGSSVVEPEVREVTPELWPALDGLFATTGAVGRCWCMYWRIGPAYDRRPSADNRQDLRDIVDRGPAPGLVALDGELAVGWCQLTPRSELPGLERSPRLRAVDDVAVLALSCFYVRKAYRRRGITGVLVDAAVEVARARGVDAIEAYPLDPGLSPSSTFTGYVSTFEKRGFEEIARRAPARPILRRRLTPAR